MAPTLSARCNPSPAPRAAASMTFTSVFSTRLTDRPAVSGSASSGYMSLPIISAAGADMTDAAMRCPAMSGKKDTRKPT